MKAEQFFWLQGNEVRAARVIFRKFHINRYELQMLTCLAACLGVKRRHAIGHSQFLSWIGGSSKFNKKVSGYIWGLIGHGCLHRMNYKMQADKQGKSYAISEYGGRVLEHYWQAFEMLEQPTGMTLKEIAVNIHEMSEKLPRYNLFISGKN